VHFACKTHGCSKEDQQGSNQPRDNQRITIETNDSFDLKFLLHDYHNPIAQPISLKMSIPTQLLQFEFIATTPTSRNGGLEKTVVAYGERRKS
jgi:hypothetical protein